MKQLEDFDLASRVRAVRLWQVDDARLAALPAGERAQFIREAVHDRFAELEADAADKAAAAKELRKFQPKGEAHWRELKREFKEATGEDL